MSIADKLLKDAPLPISWKPSAKPPMKWKKRGPGRPRKTVTSDSPQTVMIADSDREKENEPNSSTISTGEVEGNNSPSMKWLYGTKQKIVVAYAKMHSIAAATKHFTIPRTTIAGWIVDGYFERVWSEKGSWVASHLQYGNRWAAVSMGGRELWPPFTRHHSTVTSQSYETHWHRISWFQGFKWLGLQIHASTLSCTPSMHIHGPRIACYPRGMDSSILLPDNESGWN